VVRTGVAPGALLHLGAWLEAGLPQGGLGARRTARSPGSHAVARQVEQTALALLRQAFHTLSDEHRRPARASTREQHRRWVDAARSYLLRNLGGDVQLADLARAVHASPYHLSRVFRAATGMPPHRYLRHLRMAAAVAALGDDRPLGELALLLGFSSASHFSSAFRAELGVTPSSLRRRVRRAARRSAAPCNTPRGGT
jgi:AraC-like DNA-binding protein